MSDANFTPNLGEYKSLQPFRFWCQKVLPLVYDDSLSYYELLCKVIDYLNKTMEDVETLHGDVTNLHKAYVELQGYVNNYFNNLDVQNEINNKLDSMATDGTLLTIISPTISAETANWLSQHITNPSNPPIDTSLTVSGAAADAKTVSTRLLKDGLSYCYQYDYLINYKGAFDNTKHTLNGSSFITSEFYSEAQSGTVTSLVGFFGRLLKSYKLPEGETIDVYYVLDLRNQENIGSFSLWLSESDANWNNEKVAYGGFIPANFGEINIYKATLPKRGSTNPINNVILRLDNLTSVPENVKFTFALLTGSELYELFKNTTQPKYDVELCFWGDSLTAGAGGNGTTYPDVCAKELNIKSYKNCGVGGENANTIACRQGGNALILPPGSVSTYSVNDMKDIFNGNCNPLRQGNGSNTVNPIAINGIECTLSISQTSATDPNATYTITGYNDILKSETPVKFSGCDIRANINVFFVGQNGPDLTERLSIIDSMISKSENKYIVLGLSTGNKTNRENEEKTMLNKYGVHYFNTRHLLSQYGCSIINLTPTASDNVEISAGEIPSSLRSDNVHLNANGYTALGKLLAMKIRANGYV